MTKFCCYYLVLNFLKRRHKLYLISIKIYTKKASSIVKRKIIFVDLFRIN